MIRKTAVIAVSLMLAACVVFAGCGKAEEPAASAGVPSAETGDTYTMQVGLDVPEGHPYAEAMEEFKSGVEEATGGKVTVEIITDGVLGSDKEMLEMVTIDTLQGTVVSADTVDAFAVSAAPYLFETRKAALKALDGEFGEALSEETAGSNLILGGWGDGGFRIVSNNSREIPTPDYMKGIRIGTPDNEIEMDLFRLFAASPVAIGDDPLAELNEGNANALDTTWSAFIDNKLYKVQRYVTVTNHSFTAAPFLVSRSWLESLPEEYQTVVMDKASEWAVNEREKMAEAEKSYIKKCAEKDVTVRELNEEERIDWLDRAAELDQMVVEKYGEKIFELAKQYN